MIQQSDNEVVLKLLLRLHDVYEFCLAASGGFLFEIQGVQLKVFWPP